MFETYVLSDKSVQFRYYNPEASEILVAGNFSGWQKIPMHQGNDGWWSYHSTPMMPGETIYKFLVDNNWQFDQYNLRKTADHQNNIIYTAGFGGQLLRLRFHSESLDTHKNMVIYLPPSYPFRQERSYPTLYLLPNNRDNETTWAAKSRIDLLLDRLIAAAEIDELIVVMPDSDPLVEDQVGKEAYLRYLVVDLPNAIEADLRVIREKRGRALDGVGLSANWCLYVGMVLPQLFCSIGSMNGKFKNSFYPYARNNIEKIRSEQVRFRLVCSSDQPELVENNHRAVEFLAGKHIPMEFFVRSGVAGWDFWSRELVNALKFHMHSFRLQRR